MVFRTIALESTLPPHSDGAARRVSERIESCFRLQSEFLLHDLSLLETREVNKTFHEIPGKRSKGRLFGNWVPLWEPWKAAGRQELVFAECGLASLDRSSTANSTLSTSTPAFFQNQKQPGGSARLLLFAKTLTDCGINNIAAAVSTSVLQ